MGIVCDGRGQVAVEVSKPRVLAVLDQMKMHKGVAHYRKFLHILGDRKDFVVDKGAHILVSPNRNTHAFDAVNLNGIVGRIS